MFLVKCYKEHTHTHTHTLPPFPQEQRPQLQPHKTLTGGRGGGCGVAGGTN